MSSLLVLLSAACGCAGKNFVRPPDGALVLGKTSRDQVLAIAGAPETESTGLKNGRALTTLNYGYASLGTPAYGGTTPARILILVFDGPLLVSKTFFSSFMADNTDFDEQKALKLVNDLKRRTYSKRVIITFDSAGIVEEYEMIATGDKL